MTVSLLLLGLLTTMLGGAARLMLHAAQSVREDVRIVRQERLARAAAYDLEHLGPAWDAAQAQLSQGIRREPAFHFDVVIVRRGRDSASRDRTVVSFRRGGGHVVARAVLRRDVSEVCNYDVVTRQCRN